MAGQLDLERARYLMRAQHLDALLLCTPENLYYGTGVSSMLFDLYRQAPMGMALIPLQPGIEPAIIVPAMDVKAARQASGLESVYGYPVWTEPYELVDDRGEALSLDAFLAGAPVALPAQYERQEIARLLQSILKERGLAAARVGMEMDFVDANTLSILQEANPEVSFVDSTALMYDLRAVKSPAEVEALRHACLLTEAGIEAAVVGVSPGTTATMVAQAFTRGVWGAARERDLSEALGKIDGQPGLGGPGGAVMDGRISGPGATIKFDVQVAAHRYHSDVGRTFVYGPATAEQRRVYAALLEAHTRAREILRPGVPICDIFAVAQDSLRRAGLRRCSRGHFGHSVGLDPKIEEPPFIAASEQRPLLPGMVLAVEVPFYCTGLGLFQLEDMCLITDDGCQVLSQLSRQLVELDKGV